MFGFSEQHGLPPNLRPGGASVGTWSWVQRRCLAAGPGACAGAACFQALAASAVQVSPARFDGSSSSSRAPVASLLTACPGLQPHTLGLAGEALGLARHRQDLGPGGGGGGRWPWGSLW